MRVPRTRSSDEGSRRRILGLAQSLSLSLATDSPNSPRLISILARLDSLSLDTFTYYLFLVVIPAAVVCSFNHTAVQAAKVQSSGLLPN